MIELCQGITKDGNNFLLDVEKKIYDEFIRLYKALPAGTNFNNPYEQYQILQHLNL